MRHLLLTVFFLILLLTFGCAKQDESVTSAPPPGPNAVPETRGGQPKNMPKAAAPMNAGAAAKPAGM